MVKYRGLSIYGCPVVVSRLETHGSRFVKPNSLLLRSGQPRPSSGRRSSPLPLPGPSPPHPYLTLTLHPRYYSNAFERTRAERRRIFEQIPDHLDLLLTHTPPMGVRTNLNGCGDLSRRLHGMAKRGEGVAPRVHCFGHEHSSFGLVQNEVRRVIVAWWGRGGWPRTEGGGQVVCV